MFKSKWVFDASIKYLVVEMRNAGPPEPIEVIAACRSVDGVVITLENLSRQGLDATWIQVCKIHQDNLEPVTVM